MCPLTLPSQRFGSKITFLLIEKSRCRLPENPALN
jgi:hypothetical protein